MSTTGGRRPAPEHHGDAEVVAAAERVDVAVHRLPRERVRLRREIRTREVEVRVTVRREVLRVERLPVEDGDPDAAAAPTDQAPLELLLREERPVVDLQVAPYERVRVAVEAISLPSLVDTTARREVVDVTTEPPSPQTDPTVPRGTSRRTTRTP